MSSGDNGTVFDVKQCQHDVLSAHEDKKIQVASSATLLVGIMQVFLSINHRFVIMAFQ